MIGPNGENLGVITVQEALKIARESEKDLVEVSPGTSTNPPVCRILNFGKFLYEKAKKDKEARKTQKTIEIKEIRLRPKTTDHHRSFKVRAAREWLLDGMKVKVRIKFRGREIDYPKIAREELATVARELADVAIVEVTPDMEGRTMLMVLAPIPAGAKKQAKPAGDKEKAPPAPKSSPKPMPTPVAVVDDDDDED